MDKIQTKIYTALQRGDYHFNHCEDYLFVGEIGNDKLLCAVMDGCTMAKDSYFASTLVGKLLRKITIEQSYKAFYTLISIPENIDDCLKSILNQLFEELVKIKNQLLLEKNELLTTLIILLLDKKTNNGLVLTIGDGLVAVNGNITIYDQENKPDYLGFHLGEDFELWYKNQTQKIFFDNFEEISIATDGIFMFEQFNETKENIDVLDFLIKNKENMETEEMLYKKLKKLEKDFGLKPTDDVGMVRIIKFA